MQPNLAWVRTAAQAAVALKLHGVLETTGLPSASARLQHASLPTFDNSRNSTWADDDGEKLNRNDSEDSEESRLEESFEEGVMHVQDELESDSFVDHDDDGGYDLLPLPVPAPERQILNVSEAKKKESGHKETRFRYGSPHLQEDVCIDSPEDEKRVFLGEMAIDENIDKLREVIGSVDNILSRCTASSGGIERSRRLRLSLHLDILRGLDSWEGLRGKFVSQRALLKGVSGIEQSKEVFEESDLALIDGELPLCATLFQLEVVDNSGLYHCFLDCQTFLGKLRWHIPQCQQPKTFALQCVQRELPAMPRRRPLALQRLHKWLVTKGRFRT
jgi:hypothetical protein